MEVVRRVQHGPMATVDIRPLIDADVGVGLYADYGSAQRMYASRGYVPDGRGMTYRGVVQPPGATVRLDDDLALMMSRRQT